MIRLHRFMAYIYALITTGFVIDAVKTRNIRGIVPIILFGSGVVGSLLMERDEIQRERAKEKAFV